jgi:Putative prokaryotic signal transducing protein
MFCSKCRTEYRKGFTTCADCEIPLVPELPPETTPPPAPEYVNFINLYSPRNEIELSLIKSILDSEGTSYFVRNDNFGSLEVGPHIGLYNAKMITVQDDQYDKAKELLADFLDKTREQMEDPSKKYSIFDKIRIVIEFLIFGWIMPGKIKHKE